MIVRQLSEQEFDLAAKKYDRSNFWQTSQMCKFKEKNGWKIYYVGMEDNGEIVACVGLSAYPLKFGFYAFEASRGICIDYENKAYLEYFVKELSTFIRKNKGLYFRMDPYYPLIERDKDGNVVEGGFDHHDVVEHLKQLGFKHYGYTTGIPAEFEPRWAFVLDLEDKDEEMILKEMTQKTRNQVITSQKKGIHIRDLGIDEVYIFNDMMHHTAERRHFENREDEFYTRLYENLQSIICLKVAEMHVNEYIENTKEEKTQLINELEELNALLEAKPNHKKLQKRKKVILEDMKLKEKRIHELIELKAENGEIIPMASSFFVTYGNEVFYLFSASYDKYLKYMPSVALQWEMIRYGIKHQYKRYNFYGISGNFDEKDEGYGVYMFKKGFNGYVEELIGVFEKPVSKFYNVYNLLKKVIGH